MSRGTSEDLPVLGDVDGRNSACSFSGNLSRQNSSGGRFPPSTPRTSVGALYNRRTPTPTKQIALQAVKRREERKDDFDDVDLEELNSSLKLESERSFLEREHSKSSLNGIESEKASHNFRVKLPATEGARPKDAQETNFEEAAQARGVPQKDKKKQAVDNSREEQKESSSDDSDDDSEEETKEKRRAPNQLLMEFLGCLMEGDFPNAAKLCKMILIYEPDHPEALKFQPLIEERMELNEQMDSDDDDESGSDDDDDDDDDDDSSDNSDDSFDEDENDSQDEKTDSGISSAHSNCNSD